MALTRQTFVSKVMSLLYNMLPSFGHSFTSKKQVSFNFMAAITICIDFGAPNNKVSHCFSSICHEVMGPDSTAKRNHKLPVYRKGTPNTAI